MIAIGFVALLAGYTLTYWGGSLLIGKHIPLGCLLLNKNCPTSSATSPSTGTSPGSFPNLNPNVATPGMGLVPGNNNNVGTPGVH